MLLSDLDGILYGTVSVVMPERGYIISFDNAERAIEEYGDREVVTITGNINGTDSFEDQDFCYEGLILIELGD